MKFYKFFVPLVLFIMLFPLVTHAQGFQRRRELKSVNEARGQAINNTIFPVLAGVGAAYLFKNKTISKIGASLAIYGLVVGPSTGNFYAEDYLRGTLGIVMRAGSGYLLLDATRELMGDRIADPLGWDDKSVSLTDTEVMVGAGIFLGSMIYNVLSAKASVNEHNQALGYSMFITHESIAYESFPMITGRLSF